MHFKKKYVKLVNQILSHTRTRDDGFNIINFLYIFDMFDKYLLQFKDLKCKNQDYNQYILIVCTKSYSMK